MVVNSRLGTTAHLGDSLGSHITVVVILFHLVTVEVGADGTLGVATQMVLAHVVPVVSVGGVLTPTHSLIQILRGDNTVHYLLLQRIAFLVSTKAAGNSCDTLRHQSAIDRQPKGVPAVSDLLCDGFSVLREWWECP